MPEKEKGNSLKTQMKRIEEEIASIQYGILSIVIQDGCIVQIEKSEKFRLR